MISLQEINAFLQETLDPNRIGDYGINGIQVGNNGEVKKAAFAVDASYDSIKQSVDRGCDLLVVHHGLFWGKPIPITGNFRKRLKLMLENNLALIAYHLPLDMHPEYGNNIIIINKIGSGEITPFGRDKSLNIGYQIDLEKPVTIETVYTNLGITTDNADVKYLPFGNKKIKRIASVSGGGGRFLHEAIDKECDLYITGDQSHTLFHEAQENNINVLFGGHYFTETFGIKALQKVIEEKFGLPTTYFDIPTGL